MTLLIIHSPSLCTGGDYNLFLGYPLKIPAPKFSIMLYLLGNLCVLLFNGNSCIEHVMVQIISGHILCLDNVSTGIILFVFMTSKHYQYFFQVFD